MFSALRTLFIPLLLGAVAPILIYRTLGWEGSLTIGLSFIAVVFGALSFVSCWLLPRRLLAVIVLLYAGMTIGMLIDATIDFFYFQRDRNLIPFEVIFIWVVAAIPVAVGSLLGRWFGLRAI